MSKQDKWYDWSEVKYGLTTKEGTRWFPEPKEITEDDIEFPQE